MLHCDHVSEDASALVDGDLPWWRALRIRLHLLICESCARFVRQIRATKALTETADRVQTGSPGPADDATLDVILARALTKPPPAEAGGIEEAMGWKSTFST